MDRNQVRVVIFTQWTKQVGFGSRGFWPDICNPNTGLFLQSCDLVFVIPKERSMHRTTASLVLLRKEALKVVQMWLLPCSHIYNVSSFCFVIVSDLSSFLEETFFFGRLNFLCFSGWIWDGGRHSRSRRDFYE